MSNLIEPGTTLSARSIGDSECIFTCEVISRSKSFATVKIDGCIKRCKIHVWDKVEFIYALGKYSMAPTFRRNFRSMNSLSI